MAVSIPKRYSGVSTPQFDLTRKIEIEIIRKNGAGSWVRGRWVPSSDTRITIEGNVQPLKGSELLALPESDRTKDSIKVYTVETLKTVSDVGQTEADLIVWDGKKYKATITQTYKMGVLNHTKTICFRLPETPDDKATDA